MVIVTKNEGIPRFCVECCGLNRVMEARMWPLLKMEEMFDDTEERRVFTTLEIFPG